MKRIRLIRCIMYIFIMVWSVLGMMGLISIVQRVIGANDEKTVPVYGNVMEVDPVDREAYDGAADSGMTEVNPSDEANVSGSGEAESDLCRTIYENNPELLVLVNKENELDPDYDASLQSICKGRLQASDRLYDDLCAMLKAAGNEGYEYWIASAYRSRERQQELVDEDVSALMKQGYSYADALAETLMDTMPAGHSEHETGLALDILCSGHMNMDTSQADEAGNQWLASHCAEYGFILRYPENKISVTEIEYEPWHFRYVGKEAAQYITENGLTLEEFWDSIQSFQIFF
jgi:D-alanyl-D-alanine carboxypeptidase